MTSRKSHGKTFILATTGVAVLAWAGIVSLPTNSANAKPQSSGTLACGGYYRTDHLKKRARWIFTNHNDTAINITGFRVYDWDGTKVWDSDPNQPPYGGNLPADKYGQIGPLDNTLGPYQRAVYWSEQLYPAVLPAHTTWRGHVMIHVDWEAAIPDTPVDSLGGTVVNQDRDDAGTMLARSQTKCGDI